MDHLWSILLDGDIVGAVGGELVSYGPYPVTDVHTHVVLAPHVWGRRLVHTLGPVILSSMFTLWPQIHRLSAWIPGDNRPAISLVRALGFTSEGRVTDAISPGRDLLLYGMTRATAREVHPHG